jgi:PAS domain S-box-containing protein
VTQSLHVLTQEATPEILALGFCITLMLFAILFGARHVSPREKHRGLVAAIAFESLIKLLALLVVGFYALFGIFGGPAQLNQWLAAHPQAIEALYAPVREQGWSTLLFLAFGAAFLLPRQFHMLFAENLNPRALNTASWLFPLFLLLLNIFIPVILWAGQYLQLEMNPDTFVLGITLAPVTQHAWLPLLTFIGGISAASAMVIVTSIALAAMSMNHLILPARFPDFSRNLHHWVLWGRRVLIGCIIFAGYLFYAVFQHKQGLVQLGLISFVAVAQFLPGILGLLYWKRATRDGFIAGLLAGMLVWAVTLLLPLLHGSGLVGTDFKMPQIITNSGMDRWTFATLWSVSSNLLLFVLVSLFTRQSEREAQAANACCADASLPLRGVVAAQSPDEFESELSAVLGAEAAHKEVQQALDDLNLNRSENRPTQLRLLRERIEKNLSGLVGPQLSHIIVNQHLELDGDAKTALADSIRYIEERLESSQSRLDGLNAELDKVRRYHRQILLDLPLGVCAISHDQQINIWNPALEHISGIEASAAIGKSLTQLQEPWNHVFQGLLRSDEDHIQHMEVQIDAKANWFNLHKASLVEPGSEPGSVFLLEDMTHQEQLEAVLAHSDRLASVGRLAAGVAHEIGNPVTGIASLAQNLRDEHQSDDVTETAQSILQQTARITAIVRSLTNFSRDSDIRHSDRPMALCEILDDAINLVRLSHKDKKIDFQSDCHAQLYLPGDRQRLSQVFVNLLSNACDASDTGDTVEVLARQQDQQLVIDIMDHGSGMPPELQDTAFEPFVTTKRTGQGTGLGLSLVHKFVEDHHGSIHLDSQQGIGTRVTVTLPSGQRPQE